MEPPFPDPFVLNPLQIPFPSFHCLCDRLFPRLISCKLSVEHLDIQFPPGMATEWGLYAVEKTENLASMNTLETDIEIAADGSLRLFSPLPHWLKPGRAHVVLTVADANTGATALEYRVPLVTRNADDFKHIPGLQLINPFATLP